jgi:hypothetical protein
LTFEDTSLLSVFPQATSKPHTSKQHQDNNMSDTTLSSMAPDQTAFTDAVQHQRPTLSAGFSTYQSLEELHVVRDGVYLGFPEYPVVQRNIMVSDAQVAERVGTSVGFASRIHVTPRQSHGWHDWVDAVDAKAQAADSDPRGIWKTLGEGRLEWLQSISAAHTMKILLQKGLLEDVNDAKMVWMYCLALNISLLQEAAETWAKIVVAMADSTKPLVGYTATLWDPRREEWRQLYLGVQAAAERGGSTLEEAWNAKE